MDTRGRAGHRRPHPRRFGAARAADPGHPGLRPAAARGGARPAGRARPDARACSKSATACSVRPAATACSGTSPRTCPPCADSARVIQVVSNLVENAIKYAPEGPIAVRAARRRRGRAHRGPGRRPGHPPGGAAPGVGEVLPRPAGGRAEPGPGHGHRPGRGQGPGRGAVRAGGPGEPPGEGACFWFEVPAAHARDVGAAARRSALLPASPAGPVR